RLRFFLRRHLTRFDTVMHLYPACESLRIREVRMRLGQIKIAFVRVCVVAFKAMLLDISQRQAIGSVKVSDAKAERKEKRAKIHIELTKIRKPNNSVFLTSAFHNIKSFPIRAWCSCPWKTHLLRYPGAAAWTHTS